MPIDPTNCRRCKRCTSPIQPVREEAAYMDLAAAWIHGFCSVMCMLNDARDALTLKTAWWHRG